jgi:uncharacterized beta-barrel protein YwiB (DUF1934 family)
MAAEMLSAESAGMETTMTKDVLISIVGLQLGADDEPVIMTAHGSYHFTNGKHYIQYDEKLADKVSATKNTIKISQNQVTLARKGKQSSKMDFDLNSVTQTLYQTPYGDIELEIKTKLIQLTEEADKVEVKLEYMLSTNDVYLSENSLSIIIVNEERR